MSQRAQLSHLLIDVDFFDKPKVRALIYKHTHLAALVYVRWLMLMSRASNASVSRDALFSIAREILTGVGTAIATPESVLDYCLKNGMISQVENDGYSNERVIKDQESCAVKRAQASDRQKNYREKSKEKSNALLTRLPDTDTVSDTDLRSKKETVTLPAALDTPQHREALNRWQQHVKKFNKRLDRMQLDTLVLNWAARPPNELIAAINQSIERDYRKLVYEPPDEKQKPKVADPPRPRLPEWVPPWKDDVKKTQKASQ